jgi:hypothetical protein
MQRYKIGHIVDTALPSQVSYLRKKLICGGQANIDDNPTIVCRRMLLYFFISYHPWLRSALHGKSTS